MKAEAEFTGIDKAIDGETVDLFAIMNSTVVELQMELERLETKEYETRDIIDTNSDETSRETTPSSSETTKPPAPIPISCDTAREASIPSLSSAAPTDDIEWQTLRPTRKGDEDYAPVSDYSNPNLGYHHEDDNDETGGDFVHAEEPFETATPLEHVRRGDPDYSPVSDYTALFHALAPARAGDADYAPVSDYTTGANGTENATTSQKPRSAPTRL